jgi:hypothetical protein
MNVRKLPFFRRAVSFLGLLFVPLSLLARSGSEPFAPAGPPTADPDKAGPPPGRHESFGIADQAVTWLSMAAFAPRTTAGHAMAYSDLGYQNRTGGTDFFLWAPLNLPNGVVVNTVRLFARDNSASDAGVFLTRFEAFPDDLAELGNASTSGTPGVTTVAFSPNHVIDNSTNAYVIYISLPVDANLSAKGVRVLWTRQMSPAPAVATFADVPTTHLYFRAIEAMADSGITVGCGSGNFCSDQNVTRGEFAAFLSRALGLHFPF